jgi:hypothetical protein
MAIKKEELVPEILNRAGIEAIAPLWRLVFWQNLAFPIT